MTQSSAVQRCLNISEVIHEIVSYAAKTSRSDAVALSTTCRLFHDAAQDVIWADLTTLADLLKCFPEDVWKLEFYNPGIPLYQRPAVPQEWTRFLANAARVKSFTFKNIPTTAFDPQWLPMLAVHRPVLDIFPNMCRLEWHHQDGEALAFAHLFISAKLRSLLLTHNEYDEGFEWVMSLINSVIHRRCPLREFRLQLGQDSYIEEVDLAVRDLVSTTELEVYDSNALVSSDTLNGLIQSPTLKTLKIPEAEILSLTYTPSQFLPRVEVLHIAAYDVRHCFSMVENGAARLKELTVTRGQDPTGEAARGFFKSLSTRREFWRIKSLSFLPHENLYRAVAHQSVPRPQKYKLNDALFPLYTLIGLTHLNLTSIHLDVTDDLIATLTARLPLLQSLLLLPGYYCKRPLNATLNGVRLAAMRLRFLRTLGFAIDTSKEPNPLPERAVRINTTCSAIDFADSPLPRDKVDFVGAFLSSFLRNSDLQILSFSHEVPASGKQLHEMRSLSHRGNWRMVRAAMRLDKPH